MSKTIDLNSSDCQVIEEHVSIVNLDTTEEELAVPEEDAEKPEPFLHMEFQDENACKCLLEKIRRSVESFLKTKDKKVRVVVDESGQKADIFAEEASEAGSIFMVDNKPSIRLKTNEVPTYLPSERSTLHNGELPGNKVTFKKTPMCYNCSGSHSLIECTQPRNPDRIRRARMQNANSKLERYHTDIEQKFAHIKPGRFSENLRKALGLHRKNLPVFVYRMRLLGYPPGWLEEAKISHSGLNLFDSEGRSVRPDTLEDGEVHELRAQYNPERIIDFPGFNVDPPKGSVDEAQLYGVPPMMQYHRKEVMFKMFGLEESQPGYKRKKLGELEATSPNGDANTESQDMDIADNDESETSPEQHFALSTNEESSQSSKTDQEASQESENGRTSPSLDELQAAQERLLEELNSNSSSGESSRSGKERPRTPENRGKSLSTMPGTPILVPFSPYSRLPDGDRWAKGVSGVIDFENLPDSTGKYEKMKGVLEKVRETVCKIHKE
uniref:PSP proline-rich domain-containing protein n=1 Tax=Phlebotomus papatasi TaxID=29031 RepID=A0A1B0DEL8_PHLPP